MLNGIEGHGHLPPRQIVCGGLLYRRLGKKTRNTYVATLSGRFCLWRFGYRSWDSIVEASILLLKLRLSLVAGATPALTDDTGRQIAVAGATQNQLVQQL